MSFYKVGGVAKNSIVLKRAPVYPEDMRAVEGERNFFYFTGGSLHSSPLNLLQGDFFLKCLNLTLMGG